MLYDQFESKNFTGSQIEEEEEDREETTKELDPETPTSVSTLFNKKLHFLARNEYAAAEDAGDGKIGRAHV